MKVLFVTNAYSKGSEEYLQKLNRGIPLSIQANTFQWAVIEGLCRNGADFEVISQPSLCCYPINFKKLYSPQMDMVFEGKKVGTMLKTLRLKFASGKAGGWQLKSYAKEWAEKNKNEDRLVILVYATYSGVLKTVTSIKKDYPNMIVCPIVTDLVDDLLNPIFKRSLRFRLNSKKEIEAVKRVYSSIDRFILLTRSMEEKIPEAIGKDIVIEGIALNPNTNFIPKKETKERKLLYTGSLEAHTSVMDLVDAFMLTKNPHFRLIVCGSGAGSDYIKIASTKDSRVVFKGFISREEVLRLQQEATAVINPRKPTISLTKYSFPSKTMEYLSSGTPMIGYRLEGIPEEYYPYMYTVERLANEDLAKTISEVLEKPQDELDAKAKEAMAFIATQKNAKIQVEKILGFLSK